MTPIFVGLSITQNKAKSQDGTQHIITTQGKRFSYESNNYKSSLVVEPKLGQLSTLSYNTLSFPSTVVFLMQAVFFLLKTSCLLRSDTKKLVSVQ